MVVAAGRQTQKKPLKGLNGVKPEGENRPPCDDHSLFGQLSCHVYAIVELRTGDFIGCAFFSGLCGNFCFCAVKSGSRGADALGECTERHYRKRSNYNKSFDGFHGRVPEVIYLV